MKMLSDKQIKTYLKWIQGKSKRHKNKAKSRFLKDFNRYSAIRVQIMRNKMNKLYGAKFKNRHIDYIVQ